MWTLELTELSVPQVNEAGQEILAVLCHEDLSGLDNA